WLLEAAHCRTRTVSRRREGARPPRRAPERCCGGGSPPPQHPLHYRLKKTPFFSCPTAANSLCEVAAGSDTKCNPVASLCADQATVTLLITESNEKLVPSVLTTLSPWPDQISSKVPTAGSLGPPWIELPIVPKSRVAKSESANRAVPAPGWTSTLSSATATVQKSPLAAIPGLKSCSWDVRPTSSYRSSQ